jgi:hypothetical protein
MEAVYLALDVYRSRVSHEQEINQKPLKIKRKH